jgi:hypothetical protein
MRYILTFFLLYSCYFTEKLWSQDLEQIGKGKAVRFSGMVNIQGGPYIYSGAGDPRNDPFWWQINGSPVISLYGWQIPFSFNYGSRSRSFSQPFNRFGLSPYYKWLTIHAGYRSIRMNPYVMSGAQFLGAGVEMNPKGFRFAAFYGRFAKPIAQDTNASITNTPIPAFKRMGYGAKIGVGNRRSYFDISLVKVYDQPGSTILQDTNSIKPQDNLALGLSSRLAITKRITFQFEFGASLLNRDLSLQVLDTLGFMNPIQGLFQPKLGFQALTAGNASLNYTHKIFGLKVQVKQVDPDYRALAAFYQQSDLRSLTVEPSLRLKKNKIRISGSIGRQQDNIYSRKAFTSVRTIGSANISLQPSKEYNLNLNFSNYGLAQQAGLQVVNDTFRIAQNNRSISLGQNYSRSNKQRSYTLALNISYQELQDLNPLGTYASGENQVWFMNLNGNRIRLRDNLGFQGGMNLSNNSFSTGSYLLIGPSLGVSKPFLKDKLQSNLNISFNKGFQAGKSSGSTINSYANLAYQVNKSHQFNLTINLLHNSTPFVSPINGTFTEIRFLAGYTLIFQSKS